MYSYQIVIIAVEVEQFFAVSGGDCRTSLSMFWN